jgi:hypothetical protein
MKYRIKSSGSTSLSRCSHTASSSQSAWFLV